MKMTQGYITKHVQPVAYGQQGILNTSINGNILLQCQKFGQPLNTCDGLSALTWGNFRYS